MADGSQILNSMPVIAVLGRNPNTYQGGREFNEDS